MIDDEVIVEDGVGLKLTAVSIFNNFAVTIRELSGDFCRFARNDVNESERPKQQNANNNIGDKLAEEIVGSAEMSVLPNDVGGLASFFKFHRHAKKGCLCLETQGQVGCILFLEGDEASSRAR